MYVYARIEWGHKWYQAVGCDTRLETPDLASLEPWHPTDVHIPKFPRGGSKPKKRLRENRRENRAIIHTKDNHTHGIAMFSWSLLLGLESLLGSSWIMRMCGPSRSCLRMEQIDGARRAVSSSPAHRNSLRGEMPATWKHGWSKHGSGRIIKLRHVLRALR